MSADAVDSRPWRAVMPATAPEERRPLARRRSRPAASAPDRPAIVFASSLPGRLPALAERAGAARKKLHGSLRQRAAPVRGTDLIRDDPDLVALAGQATHGQQEILAAQSVHPTRTQHHA